MRQKTINPVGPNGEGTIEDETDRGQVWESLQRLLPSERERRLAYLLYHCGLRPREIMHFLPQEWSEIQEIYRLRGDILERSRSMKWL